MDLEEPTGVTDRPRDPISRASVWHWYAGLTDGQRSEATGLLLNKLRDFLLRWLPCQERSTVGRGRFAEALCRRAVSAAR